MSATVFPKIDIVPFLRAPFPGDDNFPSSEQLDIARTVDDCFRGIGLLFVHNVTVTKDILEALCRLSRDLFSPPDDVKRDTLLPMRHGTNMGYLPFSIEGLNTKRGPDIKEVRHCLRNDNDEIVSFFLNIFHTNLTLGHWAPSADIQFQVWRRY